MIGYRPSPRVDRVPPSGVRATLVALAILLVLGAAGCRPSEERTDDTSRFVVARVVDEPARTGPATVEVEVRRDGEPVDGAAVRVTGDMTHAGMAPVESGAPSIGTGRYRTDAFAFTMAGDWIVTVDVTYPDGSTRQVVLPLSVER